MSINPVFLSLIKITLTLAFIIFGIYRKWSLSLSVFLGGILMALLFGLGPLEIGLTSLSSFKSPTFWTLFCLMACIMLLSEVQLATGQNKRLVNDLSPYIKSPHLRLALFPALIGLLPMPGGALLSCPLIRDVADKMNIGEDKKAIINYWFRHIWESAWPLYPGYILACALAEISPSILWRYTFPFAFLSAGAGWFCLLRPLKIDISRMQAEEKATRSLASVLTDAIPIGLAISLPLLIGLIASAFSLQLPGTLSFIISFLVASSVAAKQYNFPLHRLPLLFLKSSVLKMLSLVVVIFIFKELVQAAKVVDVLTALSGGKAFLLALFIILPVIMGMLTGIMFGFVGTAFPFLLGILAQAGLYEERLCWLLLALISGHFGQMQSPLHICYLVSVQFFNIPLHAIWRKVLSTSLVLWCADAAYIALLYYFLHPLL